MVDELYPINSCVTFVYMQMTLGNKGPFLVLSSCPTYQRTIQLPRIMRLWVMFNDFLYFIQILKCILSGSSL